MCDSLTSTLLNIQGKTKDEVNARFWFGWNEDLRRLGTKGG